MTEHVKITPYETTGSGLVVTLNKWDIGLLEAIQKEGKGTTIFKSRELMGLPTKLIQLQKPVKWIVSGTLIQAQAGDYVASYRRAKACRIFITTDINPKKRECWAKAYNWFLEKAIIYKEIASRFGE